MTCSFPLNQEFAKRKLGMFRDKKENKHKSKLFYSHYFFCLFLKTGINFEQSNFSLAQNMKRAIILIHKKILQ